ncbi:MAG: haloacid dehalogenase type II [Nitrospinota bacterium]|nr:MAG: haloacid dehalogenase type II [Nitrospinota bacterium]
MLDFTRYTVLSFDCYGTLIDWETGILEALRPVLSAHHLAVDAEQLLRLYAELESRAESGEYRRYREVLQQVMEGLGERLGFTPSLEERNCLVQSLPHWQPFPDTVEALKAFKNRFRLAIISNIDDDLFAQSARHLQVPFDWVITAEQVRSYKPSLQNFRFALDRIGVPSDQILHVAQSRYHDIVPAQTLGLSTVWVNRRQGKEGEGATPPAQGTPDLEVPDLRSLVTLMSDPKP